jgi:hypothetical protein
VECIKTKFKFKKRIDGEVGNIEIKQLLLAIWNIIISVWYSQLANSTTHSVHFREQSKMHYMTFVMIRYVIISSLYPYCLGIIYLYEIIFISTLITVHNNCISKGCTTVAFCCLLHSSFSSILVPQ